MAAEALTSSLLEKLATTAINQVGRVLGVRSYLKKLQSTLFAIKAVLHDAEARSVKEESVQVWVARLKDAAYDIDDLLDEFQTYAEWRNKHTSNFNQARIIFSRYNPLAVRIKMSSKIKAITEELDVIYEERRRYSFSNASPSNTPQHLMKDRMTIDIIDETNVYGRDDDVKNILKLLLEKETDKEEDLSVVTIVGLGGLGKTTLTKLVFNHEKVKESFDQRIWVCASDPFDIMRIAKSIIEYVTQGGCDLTDLAPTGNRVQEILTNKKFLLVLDDVWNHNQEKWEELKDILAAGAKGSKIIVTTRDVQVASIMGTISPYSLGPLSKDACWRLFEKRAFSGAEDVQRVPFLETIGREIVAKCRGSPLAAKAVGSLMSSKREREQWVAVRDSNVWIDKGDQVKASLRLSYDHLPPHLKQCFAYCSIFPKDTIIEREELVLHWIAMGFIPYNTMLESAINKGNEYFDDLVWISFLDKYDEPWSYKMHDLVHDLAKSVAGNEQFICYADQKATIPSRCRFCTLIGSWNELELKHLFQQSSKVRALRLESLSIDTSILFTSLPCLRVLVMEGPGIKEVHASIDRLQHLRYFKIFRNEDILELPSSIGRHHNLLDLRASCCSEFNSLPQSFTSLQKLITLNLIDCERLGSLPESLDGLQSLHFLSLTGCSSLVSLPESIGRLANLRTLHISGCTALHSLPQSIGNLSNLEKLDLQRCVGIVDLPESIGKLANLTSFKM